MKPRIKTQMRNGGTIILADKQKSIPSVKSNPKDKKANSNVDKS